MKSVVFSVVFGLFLQAGYAQWIQVCTDFEPNSAVIAFDSTIIAGVFPSGSFDMAVSKDEGNTWFGENLESQKAGITKLYEGNSSVYAVTETKVFRAAKQDLAWLDFSQGLPGRLYKIVERDSILLASSNTTIYAREPADTAWRVLCNNLPMDFISDIDFDGNILVAAGSDGVCESYDMGITWNTWEGLCCTNGIIAIKGDTVIHASPGGVTRKLLSSGTLLKVSDGLIKLWTPPPGWDYFGTFEQFLKIGDNILLCGETGIYKLGNSWHWESAGLQHWVYGIGNNPESLFAGTSYYGVWRLPLNQLILSANYTRRNDIGIGIQPNPSFGSFFVKAGALIHRIEIYNNQGQFMALFQPVANEVQLDLHTFPEGLYNVHIISSEGAVVNQVIVLKK